jgi:hypothetical protein
MTGVVFRIQSQCAGMYNDVEILFAISFIFAESRKKNSTWNSGRNSNTLCHSCSWEKDAELGLLHNVAAVLLLIRF